MSRYHERRHRRGAGRRSLRVPIVVPTDEPDETPEEPATFIPGWPFPACTTAWNMAMSSNSRRAFFRVGCPKTGTLKKVWLHLKCGTNSSAVGNGYGAGNTGELSAAIYRANAAGKPGTLLHTDTPFTPGWYNAASGTLDRDNQNSVYIDAGSLSVTEDDLLCIVWWNSHANPGSNYFSINALHDDTGPHDAFAANNMATDYAGATNGFDPRTNTGWSTNSGSTWTVPGGPFGGAFQPAYGLEYSDGTIYGQPTYYGGSSGNTSEVQTHKLCGTHTFTHLASLSPRGGTVSNIVIKKNGNVHETLTSHAATAGVVVRTALASPLSVTNSDVITVEFNASGRKISNAVADGVWDDLLNLGTGNAVYPENVDHRVSLYLEPIPVAWKLTAA